MAAAKKPAAKAGQRPRAKLAQVERAPQPPGMAKKAVDTEGRTRDISGDSNPEGVAIGVDPRDAAHAPGPQDNEGNTNIEGGGYVDTAGSVHAAPPTPTVESAATANDAPGAGDSTGHSFSRPRRQLAAEADVVDVEPTRSAFMLTSGHGAEAHYPAGTTRMPRAHAEHWYAKNHGVKIKE